MKVLVTPSIAEMTVKKSRFLSEAIPVDSAEQAREVWRSQKLKYDNGGHIVYAFVTGTSGGIMGCSDDGEPAGTAGRPTLEVVKNSGITNFIVTTARWYGGIKLGTGGLVKAYTEAAQLAVSSVVTRELQLMAHVNFALPYFMLELVKTHLESIKFETFNEDYAENIRFSGRLPEQYRESLETFLRDLSKGSVQLQVSAVRME